MKKMDVAYLIVFLLLSLSLIGSLVYISLLKEGMHLHLRTMAIEEDILQAELSGLYEAQLQKEGFYISPTLVVDGPLGEGIIHFYNFFDTPKTFSFELIPDTTVDFPYDSFEMIALSPEITYPGEGSGSFFVLSLTDEDVLLQEGQTNGQYTVQIIADGEVIGQDTIEVIVLN